MVPTVETRALNMLDALHGHVSTPPRERLQRLESELAKYQEEVSRLNRQVGELKELNRLLRKVLARRTNPTTRRWASHPSTPMRMR
jgi:uncharacterized coiled-coil protein SlyX